MNKKVSKYLYATILLICLLVQADGLHAGLLPKVHRISMIALIANPEKYDGQIVQVDGFVRLEFEGNALYFHQEDYTKSLLKNAVLLDVSMDVTKSKSVYSNHYCIVEGIFKAEKTDEGEPWSGGTITQISQLTPEDVNHSL